jgi:hypothetical protein
MAVVLFITVMAVFGRLCFSEFTWYDDPATVHHNPSLNPPTLEKVRLYWTSFGQHAPLGLYIPLTYSAWAGIARLAYIEQADSSGIHLNPWMFHSANVLLHATAALVVFAILLGLVQKRVGSADRGATVRGASGAGRSGGLGVGDEGRLVWSAGIDCTLAIPVVRAAQ